MDTPLLVLPHGQHPGCTDISATWCPFHGNCTCPIIEANTVGGQGVIGERTLTDENCALHAPGR